MLTPRRWRLVGGSCLSSKNENKEKEKATKTSSSVVISGKIIDAASKENLVGVKVNCDNAGIVTYTDFDGKFSLNIPDTAKENEIKISYISYKEVTVSISDNSDQVIEISQID